MSKGRVLVVEDEVDLAWVEQFNLETEGYEAKVAPDGKAALEDLESFRPDVLVLDVMLPFVDGWSILEKLRESWNGHKRPSVIVVSAATGVGDRARAEELGAAWFIAKPFDIDELIRAVDEAAAAN